MSFSTSWAHETIKCDLCYKAALQVCDRCQVSLCKSCVKTHVENIELQHDIGTLKRNSQLVFSECKYHADYKCDVYCLQCQTPVCTKCLIGPHKGHNGEDLDSIIRHKKQEISRERENIENNIIPKYQTRCAEIQRATAEFEKLELEIKRLRQVWHKEIDALFDKYGNLIHSMKETELKHQIINQDEISKLMEKLAQTVENHRNILKSNRANKVMEYSCEHTNHNECPNDLDVKIPVLVANTNHRGGHCIELCGITTTLIHKVQTDHSSYLSREKLSKEAKVIASIPTDNFSRDEFKIACVERDEAWIGGKNTPLILVNVKGSILKRVEWKNPPRDISVAKNGKLVFTDSDNRSVNIVGEKGVQTLLTPPQDWTPWGICCSHSGDILVSVFKAKANKILRYHDEKITQEIYQNEDGNPIFSEGYFMLYIAENNNGDICVSDSNANSVVGVDMTGQIRFRYHGNGAKRKKPFAPGCILTNSRNQIIVTDLKNDCLHILDQNGKVVTCVDNCELDKLCGLGVDDRGRLWVGLPKSRTIKVIEYL